MDRSSNSDNNSRKSLPQPQAKPQPQQQISALLRSRLDDDFNVGMSINRSSSAPPTQTVDVPGIREYKNDLRANPEYAAYFYNNSRLDPRLPPPIYAPGQSWQMWAQNSVPKGPMAVGSDEPYEADPEWHSLRESIEQMTQSPTTAAPPAGLGIDSPEIAKLNNRSDSALAAKGHQNALPQKKSPPGSPKRRTLVDMIQEDFPRTPSPVYSNMSRQASGVFEEGKMRYSASNSSMQDYLDMRQTSKTPQPAMFANVMPPPRSSSTPPTSHRMRFQPGVSPLQQEVSEEQMLQQMREMNINQQYSQQQRGYYNQPQTYYDPYGQQIPAEHQVMQQQWVQTTVMSSAPPEYEYQMPTTQPSFVQSQVPSSAPPGMATPQRNGYYPPQVKTKGRAAVNGSLLEEFRGGRAKKFDLKDVFGHIIELCSDQHGSRFIQQKLESASAEEKNQVFREIYPSVLELMTDVYGNYVVQKFFEFGATAQKTSLVKAMAGSIMNLTMQMYGCRVVQKAIEYSMLEQQLAILDELKGFVMQCVLDQNGNHVVQKAVERVPVEHLAFLLNALKGHIKELAVHPYGCRVMQRIFEHCSEAHVSGLLQELHDISSVLIQDQYGNYVIQHILDKGRQKDRDLIIAKIKGNVLSFSRHKFASNVVEKCIIAANPEDKKALFIEVMTQRADGTTPLVLMMKDQFANYVVQKMLDLADDGQRAELVHHISPHFASLRKFTYGKHIIAKIEKMGISG